MRNQRPPSRCTGLLLMATALMLLACPGGSSTAAEPAPQNSAPEGPFAVPAEVALSSFIAIADGHLGQLRSLLQTLADTEAAVSADWGRIEGPLSRLEERTIAAVLWFALPDGTYWTVDRGMIDERLTDRPYFPRLLEGEEVIGDLVVSRSTGRSVAIVAVPVRTPDGEVVGVLGSSVLLERLSEQIREDMGLTEREIFYAFDQKPLLALVWDPELIFSDPLELGEEVAAAFREMLARDEGVVSYTFRERRRTVSYRRSGLTGWWYAFGEVED
jgi:hypothetical protein